jgi:hypothetical protein
MRYLRTVQDYSTTPLSIKLGIKDDSSLALLHAPKSFAMEIPSSVEVKRRAQGHVDVVVAFFSLTSMIEGQIETLGQMILPDGSLWMAWPKRSSGVSTDISDHAVRDIALPLGLVDNKVCIIDGTWTALRLVWRRTRRALNDET